MTPRSRISRRAAVLLLAWLITSLLHSSAYAFQNPARFVEDAAESGGGSQRFFTGSRADSYTCKVCHAPGQAVHVDVTGLPLHGYVPGMTYAFTVDWPDDLKAVGLNLEITDGSGLAAGELSIPPVAQLTAADLCSSGGQSGAGVFPMDKRAVAVVGECGQHQATLVWKAPEAVSVNTPAAVGGDASTVWLSGSLVVSDGDSSVAGDNVTDIRRALPMSGGADPNVMHINAASCLVQPENRRPRPNTALSVSIFVIWSVWLRRRGSRRRDTRHGSRQAR